MDWKEMVVRNDFLLRNIQNDACKTEKAGLLLL